MSKNITIKLTKSSSKVGPFSIYDQSGNIISEEVEKATLIAGMRYTVADSVTSIRLVNSGVCNREKTHTIGEELTSLILANSTYRKTISTCLWRHLTNINVFNNFYGEIAPYILEIPFHYNADTEILQSIKDYTKVFKYIPNGNGVFSYTEKVELDEGYFNKLIVYNSQQSSGVLNLVAKPKNNLKEYLRYPLYNEDSRSIIYTKSDGWYKVNNIYDVVKDKSKQLFLTNCSSLSLDKSVNQENMTYTQKSFNKSLIRAKDVKVRYILDDRSNIHLVSQILLQSNQLNYK